MHKSIKYFGHVFDASGLLRDPDKVEAILKAPQPQNREQLESFLGMVQYYGRHVPELSTLSGPLKVLRRKEVVFKWTPKRLSTFEHLKSEFAGRRVLTHFDDKRDLVCATEVSEYGVGAVVFHKATFKVGSNIKAQMAEQVIIYASRTISAAERNYSQIKNEALAIIIGIIKYDKYLMGTHFTLYTNHKPLVRLFDPKQATASTAAARLQRWSLFLRNYDYTVEDKIGTNNSNADALSRLLLPTTQLTFEELAHVHVLLVGHINSTPIDSKQIRIATINDPLLSQVLSLVNHGWPNLCPTDELNRSTSG